MKFLCVDCDVQMTSVESDASADETLAIVFRCPACEREIAMLANPMETQMVRGLCVEVGGRATAEQPLEGVRTHLRTGPPAHERAAAAADEARAREWPPRDGPVWTPEAESRLARVPGFVRGMVRGLYDDWAREHGASEITIELMDRAREELGLESV
jgi:hypothetical protein